MASFSRSTSVLAFLIIMFCLLFFFPNRHYTTDRIFFINNIYTGCINDKGWLMVVDSRFRLPAGACSYERLYGHEYPYFMYATNNRAGNYDKEGKY